MEISPETDQVYFDIPGFFKEQALRLDSIDKSIEKTIIKDGVKEKKIIPEPDWKKELSSFIEVDINKPALISVYTTDTIVFSDYSYEVNYKATEKSAIIRNISLLFENNSCIFVSVEKNNTNNLFSSIQELQYHVQKGYSIKGELIIRLIYQTEYNINSNFTKI